MAELTSVEDLSKLKVTELKKALKEKNLPITGTKAELVERLFEAITEAIGNKNNTSADVGDSILEESTEKVKAVKASPVKEAAAKPVEKVTAKPVEEGKTEEKQEKEPVKVATTGLSESERLKKRAERFGVVNEDIKKVARAERFGMPVNTNTSTKLSTAGAGADIDALKKRAERFGQVLSSSLAKVDEAERIKKRKERFGENTNSTPPKFAKITYNSNSADEEKKKKRAERFGTS